MRTATEVAKPRRTRHPVKRRKSTAGYKRCSLRGVQADPSATRHAPYRVAEAAAEDALLATTELEPLEDAVDDWPEPPSEVDEWLKSRGVRFDKEREI
jgi:hypothetical protein